MRCLLTAILTPSLKAQVSANNAWSVVSHYSNVGEHSPKAVRVSMPLGVFLFVNIPFHFMTWIISESNLSN